MPRQRVLGLGSLILLALAGGCGPRGGDTYVTRYPRWEFADYQRLAVLPGRATTPNAVRDASLLSERLTTLLSQNGTFEILSRADLKDVMKEQDLSLLADAIDEGTALPVGQVRIAQALVATKITDYKLIANREERRIPVYAFDRRTKRMIVTGEEVVTIYTAGAEVEGTVHLIDAATAKILLSHSRRIKPDEQTARNHPPDQSPEQIASAAARELAMEFYKVIAPTRTRVELDAKMLIIATGYFDGRYETPKRLPRDIESFMVVIRSLQAACERNDFRVGISAVEGNENLWEETFTWSGTTGPQGITFTVPLETLLTSGAPQFVVKLYSGQDPQPILRREFALVESR